MSNLEILMPRIGTNDNSVTIGSWLVKSGSFVKKGEKIAVLETTKETQELEAESDGFLFYRIDEGDELEVGAVVAIISDQETFVFSEEKPVSLDEITITNKAKKLIEKHKINIANFKHLNIVKEKDVLVLLNTDIEISRSKSKDLIIISGGGVAKMCIDVIQQTKAFNIHGITDPNEKAGTHIMGVEVLGNDDLLTELFHQGYMTAVNAIGGIANDNKSDLFFLRKRIFKNLKNIGFFVPNLIHPSASIEPSALLGEGNIVLAGASIGSEAQIGDDCIINTGAIVSHDCVIGNHVKLSPGCILAGNVHIGENSLIGMGVTIYIGVKIGKNVIISNGKNIFQDVPDNTIIK